MGDEIEALIQEILVDAGDDGQRLAAFATALAESGRFPFPARIVGTQVEVIRVEDPADERRGLVAVCRRGEETYQVSLADLTPGPTTVATSRLLGAYRRWCGLPAFAAPPAAAGAAGAAGAAWTYQPVAMRALTLAQPLALIDSGVWDPADQYWGEDDDQLDPMYRALIARGPRPQFEMEQVLPGVGPDDWDIDPISDAADLHRVGYDQKASRILRDLVQRDERCIDGWVHLGNIAFDTKGPKAAFELYDTAVAIGELSLPSGFVGVLPRGLIDNRPFLRALHGLGLCAWRQRRWSDAQTIYTNLLWTDGASTWTALECLTAVTAHQRWTRD